MYNGLPLDDRSTAEVLGSERPQLAEPPFNENSLETDTFSYTYYPGGSEIPEAVAPNIRTRSYAIEATVDFSAKGTPKGVLLAHGGRFGGHSFYIHKDQLCYVYNWLGQQEQKISCSLGQFSNEVKLKVEFAKKETLDPKEGVANPELGSSTVGNITLSINGKTINKSLIENDFEEYSGQFLTQPGKFALSGEGFNIGKDAGQPVSSDYAEDIPYEFEGATLKKVIITIKNDAEAQDPDKEFMGMLMRD
ncbi:MULTISPECIES: hypothetical protein [unclassified Tolypothrix]|uniref:hypothetical protein n=1 Tax=unclassified Tolypothrix TaxID=2649714 RepID=UPI0005EAA502|nr:MULTISPECIES: hypothetical protein [unclassified Tolypothrix]EKF00862.1 hypothetical protein FDUTEX481_08487 [Tolypothrix sp. PCC 7601]MBE9087100.1 hypothetical protein [Tolypothrix sp. LEGE 11397]UYD33646.1 hypothetical protein HG267_32885 [Tolypothrix sp. PCC 7601]BAY89883.1 hypothetical protein NIES3275_18860 [Microchaete diplosiphon NIES-3275]